ncbi:hypothetical protein HCN44_002332 [Aphidius gifuensis]|uniref:Soluble interferon alpha/beta receptor OPG204 n=1 Tax=Aphidius gifuensis TaxID=684658 RepID=A0A834Y118_APHGI|nr:interleukin-1 receptor accessory protein-like 1-B [Aphidius gifuensis]KAF7996686.1 hypothetical protein HCN44_002332 [Aphidius gifuensis]
MASSVITPFLILLFIKTVLTIHLSPHDNGLEYYCSLNKFENSHPGLQFTKEIVTTEYANFGSFKALHCCISGYRSIEWYKDDKAYPWPRAVSNFILYPESKNQTIYTHVAGPEDAGKFSCRARNDTNTLIADITLGIVGESSRDISSGYTGKPLLTYKPKSQIISFGSEARFYCEAYLGHVDLPDAKNTVTWLKGNTNESIPNDGRLRQTQVSREDNQIVGSYFHIDFTINSDYGLYRCKISNGADEEIIIPVYIYPQDDFLRNGSWTKALLFAIIILLVIVLVLSSYHRFFLPIFVILRNRFSHLEEKDGKIFDALICYNEKDSSLVFDKLSSVLQNKYGYEIKTLEISNINTEWSIELKSHTSTTRRIIIVMSSNLINNTWTAPNIISSFKKLSSLSTNTIVLCLEDLPNQLLLTKTFNNFILSRTTDDFNFDNINVLRWKHDSNDDIVKLFYWKLRYLMPAKKTTHNNDKNSTEMTTTSVTNVRETIESNNMSQKNINVYV